VTFARARHGMIWLAFAAAVVIATAPAWRGIVFGVNPALDQALAFICTGGA
jgi:hypothetical protein